MISFARSHANDIIRAFPWEICMPSCQSLYKRSVVISRCHLWQRAPFRTARTLSDGCDFHYQKYAPYSIASKMPYCTAMQILWRMKRAVVHTTMQMFDMNDIIRAFPCEWYHSRVLMGNLHAILTKSIKAISCYQSMPFVAARTLSDSAPFRTARTLSDSSDFH